MHKQLSCQQGRPGIRAPLRANRFLPNDKSEFALCHTPGQAFTETIPGLFLPTQSLDNPMEEGPEARPYPRLCHYQLCDLELVPFLPWASVPALAKGGVRRPLGRWTTLYVPRGHYLPRNLWQVPKL